MLRILASPLGLLVLLVLLVLILAALLVIGPWLGGLPWWLGLRTSPANAKGITARPMMRTSLLPKVPARALTAKVNNATQSIVLNPMLTPKPDSVSSPRYVRLTPPKRTCTGVSGRSALRPKRPFA